MIANLCEECGALAIGLLCDTCSCASEPDTASLRPPCLDEAIARTERGLALCRLALAEVRTRTGAA